MVGWLVLRSIDEFPSEGISRKGNTVRMIAFRPPIEPIRACIVTRRTDTIELAITRSPNITTTNTTTPYSALPTHVHQMH
ncbi:hypothetical protein M0804_000060 [Polistes exclamans]|nr:hypothetical protein M0804_000060 [Polistes exclamans]